MTAQQSRFSGMASHRYHFAKMSVQIFLADRNGVQVLRNQEGTSSMHCWWVVVVIDSLTKKGFAVYQE